jgi:hypothetical protein
MQTQIRMKMNNTIVGDNMMNKMNNTIVDDNMMNKMSRICAQVRSFEKNFRLFEKYFFRV